MNLRDVRPGEYKQVLPAQTRFEICVSRMRASGGRGVDGHERRDASVILSAALHIDREHRAYNPMLSWRTVSELRGTPNDCTVSYRAALSS